MADELPEITALSPSERDRLREFFIRWFELLVSKDAAAKPEKSDKDGDMFRRNFLK